MKNLQRFFAGLILTLALTATVFAGQMDCPGITQEPPSEETTSEAQSTIASDGVVTEALMIMVQGVSFVS